ncbi:hypothetical protein CGCF415_v012991 [Colletotrichum fructicola]|uniref:L-psp endoribonuclease family n=1 Tax=Colletotrichum fructicola (strain Nara gc5) TaxID=1213859 RepID=L2G1S7_COLFN|nr:uncharacterized protein CGMCC3_g12537 [Colletotrichum fructicola]KAF4476141.1 hypothetical protein CGGC5_v015249 [Colletotrichum fructicola Nara gc5]KAE9571235.1 hypothetical protein CGMCC3_g12537 [Colletotrichum fructicola]KAF4424326.1 RutC family protein YjgH [Colletotrichum fructicola]KAF4888060.1 hypothetical protein CGCFRS4_v010096 [Colletotrichum fructicola]KAF4892403.1 hypothetical protein CGCF415_v012991 [Colletotrichum fructicola]
MSHLTFFTYEGFGSKALESHAYNQAVRMDNQIWISGQGGWDRRTTGLSPDVTTQIDQAFDNVDFVLKDAGGEGWEQVAVVRSYHIDLSDEAQEAMVRNFRRWMPNHRALWTAVGVKKLGDERMLVEIEVVAHDPVKR